MLQEIKAVWRLMRQLPDIGYVKAEVWGFRIGRLVDGAESLGLEQ